MPRTLGLGADDVLYYLHIPKTAGTTFNAVLENYFRPEEIWPFHARDELRHIVGERLPHELARTPPEVLAQYRLIRGHYDYGIHRFLPRRPYYVTMLRDPVPRILSLYRYIRRVPSHRLHDEIIGGTRGVRDLLDHPLAPRRFNDRQVHQLAGTLNSRMECLSSDETLARAKAHLQEVAFFGLAERFDDSLRLLYRTFGWEPLEAYRSLNVSPPVSSRSVADETDRMHVARHNQLDIELYRFAQELFDKRVSDSS